MELSPRSLFSLALDACCEALSSSSSSDDDSCLDSFHLPSVLVDSIHNRLPKYTYDRARSLAFEQLRKTKNDSDHYDSSTSSAEDSD